MLNEGADMDLGSLRKSVIGFTSTDSPGPLQKRFENEIGLNTGYFCRFHLNGYLPKKFEHRNNDPTSISQIQRECVHQPS